MYIQNFMARPRLVQEGEPLYRQGSDDESDNVFDSIMNVYPPQPNVVSSLQHATSSNKSSKRMNTSYVIGGAATTTNHHQEQRTNYHSHHNTLLPQHLHPSQEGNEIDISMEMYAEDDHNHHYRPERKQIQTSHVIGGVPTNPSSAPPSIDKMEGVLDQGSKMPLVVLDGANVAHAYADAMASMKNNSNEKRSTSYRTEANVRGIQVATEYFRSTGVRVLIVLPRYWLRTKPRPGDTTMMDATQMEILNRLNDQGLIVQSPPADDDDAYALTIAKREEIRALTKRNGEGPGFVLSNDMFRDAQARDPSGVLQEWLNEGRDKKITGPGRISYTFCDMGTMNDNGDRILDFVPNPRHPLVTYVEGLHLQILTSNK